MTSPPPTLPRMSCALLISVCTLMFAFTRAQTQQTGSVQASWPHVYPGMPVGDYSPEWQNYFQVTENLPNVTWPIARNWAGNLPVQRPGHPNNTLFFWAFESSEGSFTANSTEPWAIWLNGGPGSSSLVGLLFENGPLQIKGDYSLTENQYAWTTLADYVWIDQPAGAGFSTVDADGLVANEDQLAADFMGFLENLVKVFPNLATRPLVLTGESYAGVYIPYITKAFFQMKNPPVNLYRIAIGNGAMTPNEACSELAVVTVLETYPQIIGYDIEVFKYFQEQSALCGYNLTLQYPQPGYYPTLKPPMPPRNSTALSGKDSVKLTKKWLSLLDSPGPSAAKLQARDGSILNHEQILRAQNAWKRDLAGRPNGSIDPWYLCDLYTEMYEYAINFTYPWSMGGVFDNYQIPDALSPEVPMDGSVFLNDDRTRAAIHAPMSKNWTETANIIFAPTNLTTNINLDPSVAPIAFMSELATNATAHNMKIIIYSGNDDSLIPHFGSQIAIQNTTFGGTQGFTRKPETPWYDDAGEFAGIVHQERGWTYVLVDHAGHLLSRSNPKSALVFAREFIFGDNSTGLVSTANSGAVTVVGGESHSLEGEILTGQAAIYYGSATTASSYFFPSATVEAWDRYIATATAVDAKVSDN